MQPERLQTRHTTTRLEDGMSTDEERRERRLQEMERQAAAITPGEEWIYRAQDKGRSQRVRVIGQERMVSTIQMEVEFLDGERTGRRRLVGLQRLKAPWSEVGEYDARDTKLRRIEGSHDRFNPSRRAAHVVFQRLIPTAVAVPSRWPMRGIVVQDAEALGTLCRHPVTELVTEEESISTGSGLLLSTAAMVSVAKAACAADPDGMRSELLARDRRSLLAPSQRNEWEIDSEEEVTEILHAWCGTRPLEFRRMVIRLENEVAWQRALVASAIDALRRCRARKAAENLERLAREGPPEVDEAIEYVSVTLPEAEARPGAPVAWVDEDWDPMSRPESEEFPSCPWD